jgi:hypothetical protein
LINRRLLTLSRVHFRVAAWAALMALILGPIAGVATPIPLSHGLVLAVICTANGVTSMPSERDLPASGDQQPPFAQHCVFCWSATGQVLTPPAAAMFAPAERGAPQYGVGFKFPPFSVSTLEATRSRAPPALA